MTTRHTISTAEELYAGACNNGGYSPDGRPGLQLSHLFFFNLGAPATLDVDGICDGTTVATDAATAITLLTDTMDVPRTLTVDSTDDTEVDGVVTITGTDFHGLPVVEAITANGTTAVGGKKAFKTLSTISVAACTSAGTIDIGWANIFGLPVRVDNARDILFPAADGVLDAVGTLVVADTDQDSTAGDSRGTVVPTTTPDGSVNFSMLIHVPDTSTAGAFGVAQYIG